MPGTELRVDSLRKALEIDRLLDECRDEINSVHIDHDGFLYDLIRTHHERPDFILPDRDDIVATTHCLRSFSQLVGTACEARGIRVTGDVLPPKLVRPRQIGAADLLQVPGGRITEAGIRKSIRAFLTGGRSTSRLAGAQLWQWVHHDAGVLDGGRLVTPELFLQLLDEEYDAIGDTSREAAAKELARIVLDESFTMPAF